MLWNVDTKKMADGSGISHENFLGTITGSTFSGISEAKVSEFIGGEVDRGKQTPFDVHAYLREKAYVEVRNLMNSPATFAPSMTTGGNRYFKEPDFYKKIEACDSYVFCDLRKFGLYIPYSFEEPCKLYEIDASEVLEMYERSKAAGFCHKLRANDPDYYMDDKAAMTLKRFFERFPYEEYKFVA